MKRVGLIKMRLQETCSNVRITKHLSKNFPIQNGLKQGEALSPFLFNFALEYAIRKMQENQMGLKLNGTHQLLVYVDNVNLMGNNIDAMKKNTETLTDASRQVGLEVQAEQTEHMLLSRHQIAMHNHDIKLANRSFVNVTQFKYFGTTVTYQYLI
jgi:hypothetical protein